MKKRRPAMAATMCVLALGGCAPDPFGGTDESEAPAVVDGALSTLACPTVGGCEPPPPPPPPTPLCSSACSSTAACAKPCKYAGATTTCGARGTCAACSAAVCSSDGACSTGCMQGSSPARLTTCSEWSQAARGDADLDGLSDALEEALANRFYPELNMHCGRYRGYEDGSAGQYYGSGVGCGSVKHSDGTLGGDLPYVVRRVGPLANGWCANRECIEIVYGLPYASDLGGDGYGSAHKGDTEMYAALLAWRRPTVNYGGPEFATAGSFAQALGSAGHWAKLREYAAAHRGADHGDSSTWRTNLPPGGSALVPRELWVSEGKQASYFSQDGCNSGDLWNMDDCTDNRCWLNRSIGVSLLENAGELGCHPERAYDTWIPAAAPALGACGVADAYNVWSGIGYEGGSPFRTIFTPGAVDWNHESGD